MKFRGFLGELLENAGHLAGFAAWNRFREAGIDSRVLEQQPELSVSNRIDSGPLESIRDVWNRFRTLGIDSRNRFWLLGIDSETQMNRISMEQYMESILTLMESILCPVFDIFVNLKPFWAFPEVQVGPGSTP